MRPPDCLKMGWCRDALPQHLRALWTRAFLQAERFPSPPEGPAWQPAGRHTRAFRTPVELELNLSARGGGRGLGACTRSCVSAENVPQNVLSPKTGCVPSPGSTCGPWVPAASGVRLAVRQRAEAVPSAGPSGAPAGRWAAPAGRWAASEGRWDVRPL